MNGHEDSGSSPPPVEATTDDPDTTPCKPETQAGSSPSHKQPPSEGERVLALVPVGTERILPDAEPMVRPRALPWSWIAGAAAALVGAAAGTLLIDLRQNAKLLAENARETESLTHRVKALEPRLDDIADLRRSVGEMKSSNASSHDLNGAIAQLAQRLERLDRDESAKVDRLGERVDRDASARVAELSARIDKLEKKVVVKQAPLPPPPATPASLAKPPAPPIKSGADVSMETTGSIQHPRQLLQGYVVLDVQDDVALVGGHYGEREVRPGDFLPGAGRVLRIERQGRGWVVLTTQGLITAADLPTD